MIIDWPWKREKLSEIWNWPHIFWVTVFKLWIEDNETPTQRRIKLVIRAFVIVYGILHVVSMAIATVIKISNYGVVQNPISIYQTAAGIICSFKLVELARNEKGFKQSMVLLNELTEEVKETEDVEFMKKAMFRLWVIYTLNMTDVIVIALHWCTRPYLIAMFTQERTAVMETWPKPLDTWPQFFITNITHAGAAIPFAFALAMLDNIYLCTCQYIISHMDLLKRNLEDLHLNGKQIETIKLTKIVKRHVKILRICKTLKNASSAAFTIQIVTTVIIFCTGVFAVSVNKELNVNILMNLSELVLMLSVRLFLLAWFSTEVTITSKSLGTSAYRSYWLNASELQKKQLMMLVSKTMQPILFGGLIQMDFDTFLMVFKTAFSYYNFLLATYLKETEN